MNLNNELLKDPRVFVLRDPNTKLSFNVWLIETDSSIHYRHWVPFIGRVPPTTSEVIESWRNKTVNEGWMNVTTE